MKQNGKGITFIKCVNGERKRKRKNFETVGQVGSKRKENKLPGRKKKKEEKGKFYKTMQRYLGEERVTQLQFPPVSFIYTRRLQQPRWL